MGQGTTTEIFLPLGPEMSGNRAVFGRDAKLHVAFDDGSTGQS